MEILLPDLQPGQEYFIQLRSKNQIGFSQWSRAYSFTTDSDVVAPNPVTGLSWTVSGTSFVATWTKPTLDSDGEDLRDFKDFKVTITAGVDTAVFYVVEERFDFDLERNTGVFGSPEPSLDIKIEVRDTIGNLSTPATASASNAIPEDVTGFDATSALGGISLVWNHVSDSDLKNYEIYVGSSSGFTPGPSNLVHTTSSNSFFYSTDITSTRYFKIRAVDVFNQGSANYTLESGVAYPLDGVPDTTAPSQPNEPTISLGILVAQVSHDMTKEGGGNLESDVDYLEVHASTSTGFTPSSSTLRGTIDSAGAGIPVSAAFYFPTTDSMTNLYWKIIAVDRSKNKSIASNQTTGLPGLIESINILNATITDAKIQNISAAKLIAGTAIINDLFIEAGLTVSDTGFIESENYVEGTSGWHINATGDAEFNDVTVRGELYSGNSSTYVHVWSTGVPESANVDIVTTAGTAKVRASNGQPRFQLEQFNPSAISDFFTTNLTDTQGVIEYAPNAAASDTLKIRFLDTNRGILFGGDTSPSTTARRSVLWQSSTGWLKSATYVMSSGALTTEGWNNLTLQNGWLAWGAPYVTPGYILGPDGFVTLRGTAKSGTLTDGTVVFTLPTGYRPANQVQFHVYGTTGSVLDIATNGQASIAVMPSSGTVPLTIDGFRFSTF